MCEVATIGLIISAVGAGMSAVNQRQQNKISERNAENQQKILGWQEKDAAQQAALQQQVQETERQKAVTRERAALRVAAGESGVGGIDSSIAEGEASQAAAQDIGMIETNAASAARQREFQGLASRSSIRADLSRNPSNAAILGRAALQMGEGYTSYSKAKAKR